MGIEAVIAETFIWSAPELIVNVAGSVRLYDFPTFPVIVNRAGEKTVPKGMMPPEEDLAPEVLIVTVPEYPDPPAIFPKSKSCVLVTDVGAAKSAGGVQSSKVTRIATLMTGQNRFFLDAGLSIELPKMLQIGAGYEASKGSGIVRLPLLETVVQDD